MSADQVRRTADAGVEIGSHGLRHMSLPGLDEAALAAEAGGSRAILMETIDREVTGFCYPYGHIDESSLTAVRKAGYSYGCAIWRSGSTGLHALPRVYVETPTARCACGPRAPGTGRRGITGARGAARLGQVTASRRRSPDGTKRNTAVGVLGYPSRRNCAFRHLAPLHHRR